MAVEVSEGTVSFRGYETWYRIVGERDLVAGGQLPVLMLHDGPGGSHDSFEPLERFAETGRPVVLYDDVSLCTVSLFLEQLICLREALGLRRVHLLGHSWGGMLVQEYALTRPRGLASLTLVGSTPAAALIWAARERSGRYLPSRHHAGPQGLGWCRSSRLPTRLMAACLPSTLWTNPASIKNWKTASLRLGSNLVSTVNVRARASVRTSLSSCEARRSLSRRRPLI